jgi:hypothetical protein
MHIDRRTLISGGAALAATALPLSRAMGAGRASVNRIVVEDGRVWIAAMINGKGPHFFIIDTGAGFCFMDDKIAKQLNLQRINGRPHYGIGGGVSDFSWYIAKEVTLASGTRFPDTIFHGSRPIGGPEVVGGLGAGMFTTYDSDFDFENGEWRLYPDGRGDFEGLTRLAGSRFDRGNDGQRVMVKAKVDGFSGDFLADTGASMDVMLTGRSAANSGLWNDTTPYVPMRPKGFGAEAVPSRLVRGDTLTMGHLTIDKPMVLMNQPGTVSGNRDGLIGLGVLKRFHLTTQVSGGGALWVAPNKRPVEPVHYPLAGLWLDEVRGKVVVSDVGTGSPAKEAGVKIGDTVLGGNLQSAIRQIGGPAGREVTLSLESGGVKRDVRYTLKPWL